jgi:SanA protein
MYFHHDKISPIYMLLKLARKKKFLIAVAVSGILVFLTILYCDIAINRASVGKLFNNAAMIPYQKTGLLLGTAKYLANNRLNPYYNNRIVATTELFRAGKIKYVIISGDNSRKEYNEPEDMRDDLVKEGVDSTSIYLDYAGFRTFDSVVRLKEIFGQDSVTIISQPFHNERAIYLAGKENIYAIGFNAKDVSKKAGTWVQLREKLARVKVFVDGITGKQPRFLGKKITIP